ncbi:transporter substrate-binding domain-containing protein [Alkalimonas collagenimarina]|uniref:Transporter substrate-binding domain-containing protein n=1 Tax=Alkalimonas collagenimarina TaxID=400390 RepID=A0ABT9GXC0_9GAMM|nr:transporter substrate-binding domain-containing protein [Alkalimonas collagenimarina]MDP4535695.1 transporter substrate-binding domain-containing protein [Alkalimonas collagenimarina]
MTFYTEHSPPGQFLNEHGDVDGATVRLIQLLQYRLDESISFRLLPWARAFELAQKERNSVLFETVRTPEREHLFQWVGPIKMFDMRLYVMATEEELPGDTESFARRLRACGYRGATQIAYFNTLGFEEGRNLTVTLKAGDCLAMVRHGRAEVIALNYLRYGDVIEHEGVQLQASVPLYHSHLYLAFSLEIAASRVQRWQQALDQSVQDGSMRSIFAPHYPARMIDELEKQAQTRLLAEFDAQSEPSEPLIRQPSIH